MSDPSPSKTKVLPTPILILAAAVLLIADQWTKRLVLTRLEPGAVKPVLPFFNLTRVLNTGASFGMFQDSNRAFIGMTVLILIVLAFLHRRLVSEGRWTGLGLALLWGGALGNLVDRVRMGAVVDFLDFHWAENHFPSFNAADSAITVGVALMFLQNLLRAGNEDLSR